MPQCLTTDQRRKEIRELVAIAKVMCGQPLDEAVVEVANHFGVDKEDIYEVIAI